MSSQMNTTWTEEEVIKIMDDCGAVAIRLLNTRLVDNPICLDKRNFKCQIVNIYMFKLMEKKNPQFYAQMFCFSGPTNECFTLKIIPCLILWVSDIPHFCLGGFLCKSCLDSS